MLRILRLVRALRLVATFESLGKLVHGMLSSGMTMLSAVLLILLIVYILACVGAELITKSSGLTDHEVVGPIIEQKFRSIPITMMTLMQFTTDDSVSGFYAPIVEEAPWLAIYFLVCFVVVSILLMNLVAAIVLEDALSRGHMDREQETATMRHKLKGCRHWIEAVFDELDRSGDGKIQLSEVVSFFATRQTEGAPESSQSKFKTKLPREVEELLEPELLLEVFEYLDIDASGTVNKSEFVSGVTQLALADVPLETTRILELLKSVRLKLVAQEAEMTTLKIATQDIHQRVLSFRTLPSPEFVLL
jgi:Ca2+-binding EF-hand superfamily protein